MARSALTPANRRPDECWPTDAQRLLLQAALLEGDAGAKALAEWRALTSTRELDRASIRLLPLLYVRLRTGHSDDPDLAVFEAEFERVDAKNRELTAVAGDAIRRLTAASMDTMLLKGVALVARRFMASGARPMADCDLMVRTDQALAARDVLLDAGWRLEARLDPEILSVRHAVPFRHASGRTLDLHWHALAECCGRHDDVSFWQAAEPVMLGDVPTQTLCPTDMLLHTCVHGLSWSIVPTVRWVADALAILGSAGRAVNWDRLVREAEHRTLTLPVSDGLSYLEQHFGVPIPPWVLTRLRAIAAPSWARAEYRIKMRPRSPQRQLLFHWFRHRRLRHSGSVLKDVASLPTYLRRRWGVGLSSHGR